MKLLSISMSCLLVISVWFCALYAIGAEPPMWTFDGKDAEKELKSWINLNQLAPLEIVEVKDKKGEKRSVLKTKSLGGDPYMFPGGGWNVANYEPIDGTQYNILLKTVSLGGDPYFFPGGEWNTRDWEPFSGKEFTTIYLRVKVNKTDTWQVYYVTEEETGWGETQRQNFEVQATDDFVDLEFVMERGGWQERTITGFRIDPGVSEGVEAEIDYISLKGAPTAVETNGKIATSWGKLKS